MKFSRQEIIRTNTSSPSVFMTDEPDGTLVNILPTDNGADQFISITIYNRWGGEVFKSNNRDFKWYAEDESSGVYYYTLHFTDRVYKGLISVASGE